MKARLIREPMSRARSTVPYSMLVSIHRHLRHYVPPLIVMVALALPAASCAAMAQVDPAAHRVVTSEGLCSALSQDTRVAGVVKTLQQLRALALAGSTGAQQCLGSWYAYWGSYRGSARWFSQAARGGNALAEFNLGVLYDKGLGVDRNESQAARWYRKAAQQGFADAQYNLASLYEHGLGVAQDRQEAVRWYRAAAEQGLARAEYALGVLYHTGMGVTPNDAAAMRWLRAGAEHNVAAAQYDLAVLFETGSGVDRDEAKALYWYRNAAEQGMAVAQLSLATRYLDGIGVTVDPAKAVHWLRLAAEQDDASAQCLLGKLYAMGEGVARDPVRADIWLRLATSSPRQSVARRADVLRIRIEARMSVRQRRVARSQATAWKVGQLLVQMRRSRTSIITSMPFQSDPPSSWDLGTSATA